MAIATDLTGRVFGRWTVISFSHRKNRAAYWTCKCKCGGERVVFHSSLTRGASQSCGCLIGESAKERLTVHGMSDTKPHMVWSAMKGRCLNPNNKAFKYYGGRGITVDPRWLEFENFWADMGPSYAEGLTIERRDNNAGYCPANCEWVPLSEQSKNRRPFAEWSFDK